MALDPSGTGTARPATRESLRQDLSDLGIHSGDLIVVHSSLSRLGWVCGGEEAVVLALADTISPRGTLVMPTHTPNNTEPANWKNPPVPEPWWPIIRASMPPFNPATTPTAHMGRIPECFRKFPGVLRSNHPIVSFAALGRHAAAVAADHVLEPMFGEQSPIGRMYELNGKILLIGVGYDSCTALHLAEYRSHCQKTLIHEGAAMLVNGTRTWVEFTINSLESDDFAAIGADFEATGKVKSGKIAGAPAKLMDFRELVDFATPWMNANRKD